MLRLLSLLLALVVASGSACAGPTDEQLARLRAVVEKEAIADKQQAARAALAKLLARYGREAEALAIAATLPRKGDHIAVLAYQLVHARSYAAALRVIEPAGAHFVLQLRVHIAERQLQVGKRQDAVASLQIAAREFDTIYPGYLDGAESAFRDLGLLQLKAGLERDADKTIARFRQLLETEGAGGLFRPVIEPLLGELLLAAGRTDEGIKHLVADADAALEDAKDHSRRILVLSQIAAIMQVYGLAQAVELADRAEALLARRRGGDAIDEFGIVKLAELQTLRGRTDAAIASLKLVDERSRVEHLWAILHRIISDGRVGEAEALLERLDQLVPVDLPPSPVGAPVVSRHTDAKQWALSVMATIDLKGTGARSRALIEQAAALARQVRVADARIAWWARVALLADVPGGDAEELQGNFREAWAALVDTIESTTDCCTPHASDRLVELVKHIGRFDVIAYPE